MRIQKLSFIILVVGITCVVVLGPLQVGTVHAESEKVRVCHHPPGPPGVGRRFHTIYVGEKALDAHLAHGDLLYGCGLIPELICDDGDASTVDAFYAGTYDCIPVEERAPTDCDDGIDCTIDDCDETGCSNTPDDTLCSEWQVCDPEYGCISLPE